MVLYVYGEEKMITKTFPPHTNKLLLIAVFLLVFSLFTPLFQSSYMIVVGIISSALAVIIAVFLWMRSEWEYIGWDDPLFPE